MTKTQVAPPPETNYEPGSDAWHRARKLCQYDLWFLNYVLGHGAIPLTYYTHWAAFQFAQRATGIPEIDRARVQRILVFREFGKSTGITKTRTVQNILRDPNHCVGIANETLFMAKGFLGDVKAVFEQNDFVRTHFPEVIPENTHSTIWAADQIKVVRTTDKREPTVLAAGVDRSITGVHMNEWLLDDIMSNEAAENARTGSFTEIEKIKRWMNRLEPLCDGPHTPITLIGTPWWQGDVYDYAEELWGLDEPPVKYDWVCKLPDGITQIHTLELQGEMATFKRPVIENGRSAFPEKWPMERIDRVRKADPQLFSANLMIDPSSDIVRDFKDAWLKDKYYEWTVPGQELRYRDNTGQHRYVKLREFDTVMAVDPAISESAKADRSAIVVSGSIDGQHHIILEIRAERLGVLDLCTLVQELNRTYKCRRIYVESVAYQKALAQLLAHKGLPIIEVKPGSTKTKEMRIRSLEPYFRMGHLYFHTRQHEFFSEYEHFPRGRYDDILDAMSYLTDEWQRLLGRDDKDKKKREEQDRQHAAKLRKWGYGRRR
jgi:predicted phage terminase large subunit-like protein